ncbi:1830_t:CDS:1 [Funneliformis geosporum]|uniref:14654_t:CDS:1 n=1 Tax=Funneliformis geosporum TaxID=1117311 RepID=A0A9W4WK62_9GLOM|nr:14654_t:CDS:1 [Funneliformis geosporum]CAI2169961.1 1830_t:CDS:1 [Funneliformis geosporum]
MKINNESNVDVIRPLGLLERYFQITHDIEHYYNVGLLIRYKVPLKFSLVSTPSTPIPTDTKDAILKILYPTLERMISKQQALAVVFADLYSSKPLFIRLREIDLSRIVRFAVVNDDKDIEKLLEEEHNKKFDVEDQTSPLWRIVVGIKSACNEREISNDWNLFFGIFWHHTIGDGRSALVMYTSFHESLLEILSEISDYTKEPTTKIKLPKHSTIPLGKPIEECLEFKFTLAQTVKELLKFYLLPTFFVKKQLKGYWLGDNPSFSFTKNNTKTLFYSITAEELNTLLRLSKQHKTTITSIFNIALVFSAYHHLILGSNQDDNNLSKNARELAPFDAIKLATCINLRPYTTPLTPWTQMGVYISGSESIYKYPISKITDDNNYPQLDFWKMCKEFRSDLINNGIPHAINFLGNLNLLPNESQKYKDVLRNKADDRIMGRDCSMMVSSIGKFSELTSGNPSANEWKVNDLIFCQSSVTMYSAFTINVISFEDKLTFTICYQDGVANHNKVEKFGEGTVKCLKKLVQNENVSLQDLA